MQSRVINFNGRKFMECCISTVVSYLSRGVQRIFFKPAYGISFCNLKKNMWSEGKKPSLLELDRGGLSSDPDFSVDLGFPWLVSCWCQWGRCC